MAIATAAAIGLGVAAAGSAVGAISNRNAARSAARTSQQATDQTVGLQRDVFNQNRATLAPFVNRGNAAGNQINALLGLGGSQEQGGPQAVSPNALSQFRGNAGAPYGLGDSPGFTYGGMNPGGIGGSNVNNIGTPSQLGIQPTITNTTATAPVGQTPQQAAENAFDIFRNSTGYQFRLGEGMDAVTSAYAGGGMFQSGAAMRRINEYGQNFASNEFGNYMGLLGNQQGTGMQAAGAQAGVDLNFANNASSLIMNNADNQANAAISRAQNNPFANVAGVLGGGLFGYGGR